MANHNMQGVAPISFIAGGTIVKDRLVKLDSTAGQVVATSAITDCAVGVALNGAASGEMVAVQTYGKAKAVCSAAITLGAQLMPTASGAGKVSTAAGATALACAVALETTTTDGEYLEVLLCTPNVNGPANS